MKKLLVVMLVGFGAAMLVKHGQVAVTPDNQIQVVGFAVPLPNAVQQSPLMGIVASLLPSSSAPAASAGNSAPQRPMMPAVSSAWSTYNPNARSDASAGGATEGADALSAAAKAIRGQ